MKTLKDEWDSIDAAEESVDGRKWKLAARLAKENEAGRSQRDLAKEVGRSQNTVQRWIRTDREFGDRARPISFAQAYDEVQGKTPEGETARKRASHAKSVLTDEEARGKVLDSLSASELGEVVSEADEKRHDLIRAQKAEHQKENSIGNLTGFSSAKEAAGAMSESWVDEKLFRLWSKAHDVEYHVKKWGLVLGSVDLAEALEKTEEAERRVAEVRAALQERIRDEETNREGVTQ